MTKLGRLLAAGALLAGTPSFGQTPAFARAAVARTRLTPEAFGNMNLGSSDASEKDRRVTILFSR